MSKCCPPFISLSHVQSGKGGMHSILVFKTLLIIATVSFFVLGSVGGSFSDTIEKGGQRYSSVTVEFGPGGGMDPSLSIPLDEGGPVIEGGIMVSTIPGEHGPASVSIDVGMDGREEWSFGGGSQGHFGEQINFITGHGSTRGILSDDREEIGFLLPRGASVNGSSISVAAPPTPKPGEWKTVYTVEADDISPGTFVAGDIDSDGDDELFYHSREDREVRMVHRDDNGSYRQTIVVEDIQGIPIPRVISGSSLQTGGLLLQYSKDGRKDNISIFRGEPGTDLEEASLSENVPPEMVGYSVLDSGSDRRTLIMATGNSGKGASIFSFDPKGSMMEHLVIDDSDPGGGVGIADLDGNEKPDLILFPQNEGGNITVVRSGELEEEPQVIIIEDGSVITSPGMPVDIDGDGFEEFYFTSGDNKELSVISVDSGGHYSVSRTGVNGTGDHLDHLSRDIYGDSSLFSGMEGFLSLSGEEGMVHLLPVSDPSSDHIYSRIAGSAGTTIFGDLDGNATGMMYRIDRESGIVVSEVIWTSAPGISLKSASHVMDIELTDRSATDVGISEITNSGTVAYQEQDRYGNRFDLVEFTVEGESGFVSFSDLSVEYSLETDISRSPLLLSSLRRAYHDLGGSSIPFMISASSEGKMEVGPASVNYDSPPQFRGSLPSHVYVKEGSSGQTLLDAGDHVSDDLLDEDRLEFSIRPLNDIPEGLLFMSNRGDLVSHASRYTELNGRFQFRIEVSDRNSATLSPIMELVILPVQDPPKLQRDPGSVVIEEGMSESISLTGEEGIFIDPDGDHITCSFNVTSPEPLSLVENIDIRINGNDLVISPHIRGSGGTLGVEVVAEDNAPGGGSAVALIPVTVVNVDSDVALNVNPGPIVVSEDQDTPTMVDLSDWIVDPDTHLGEYELISYSSDARLKTYFDLSGSDPFLFILPTGDLTGREMVWIEVRSRSQILTDRLVVEIEPVNDIPEVSIEQVAFREESGWLVSGNVHDPDDEGGRIEYRIGQGEWRDAWGYGTWSFLVEKEAVSGSGSYVFVRADDGMGPSAEEYTKLLWPYDPPVFDEEPGENEEEEERPNDPIPENSLTPGEPDNTGPPWFVTGGLAGMIIGGLLFLLWTEVGFVTVMTGMVNIYSKLSKKDILNHEIRGLIRGYIIANPGDHYSSIKRNLDLNNGTLAYHLRVLEQNGFVKSMYDGIYKRYYPANINISKLKKNVSKQEEIFNLILENPGITMEQIGRSMGVSRQVVNYHVKNLIRARVVTYNRDNRSARFYPDESRLQGEQT